MERFSSGSYKSGFLQFAEPVKGLFAILENKNSMFIEKTTHIYTYFTYSQVQLKYAKVQLVCVCACVQTEYTMLIFHEKITSSNRSIQIDHPTNGPCSSIVHHVPQLWLFTTGGYSVRQKRPADNENTGLLALSAVGTLLPVLYLSCHRSTQLICRINKNCRYA